MAYPFAWLLTASIVMAYVVHSNGDSCGIKSMKLLFIAIIIKKAFQSQILLSVPQISTLLKSDQSSVLENVFILYSAWPKYCSINC